MKSYPLAEKMQDLWFKASEEECELLAKTIASALHVSEPLVYMLFTNLYIFVAGVDADANSIAESRESDT